MKKVTLLAASLLVMSCSTLNDQIDKQPTFQQVNTAACIVGEYVMTQAEWEFEIDLTGNGGESRNILSQLKQFGFHGVLYIDEESVFDKSQVLNPSISEMTDQVNLYIPLFRIVKNNNTGEYAPEDPIEGMCPIEVEPYQFHYKIMEDGSLSLNSASTWDIIGDAVPYYDVHIDMALGRITLTARTMMFNRASGKWQEGNIKCEYVRR